MHSFFKTVAIVTVFSVCEKFLGFLYRIFLSRFIGAEGVGIYQVALSVFAFLLTVTCSGTPITVSRLMTKYKSENKPNKVKQIISAGLLYTLIIALPLCLIFFLAGSKLSFIFADPRCISVFLIVLPGLIFTSIYSVMRGVFWGNKDFMPYSVIELLEEICMIIFGVILITHATSPYSGAMRAGVAVLISYLFSFFLATLVFFVRKNKLVNPKEEFKELVKSATPVTAMRTVNSLAASLVSILLPLRLIATGVSNARALSLYGAAAGQAMPLLYIPTTLIGSFTLVLVPEISEHFYKRDYSRLKNEVEKAVKFTAVLSCVFIPIFLVCGEEIGVLMFKSEDCGKFLTASACLMLFMGLSGITTSILNSMGKENTALIFCAVGGGLMLIAVWALPAVLGVYALLVGYACVYAITTILNVILLYKICPERPHCVRYTLFAFLLALPAVALGVMLKKLLTPLLGTLLTIFACGGATLIFTALLYLICGLVDIELIKRFKPSKRKTVAVATAENIA